MKQKVKHVNSSANPLANPTWNSPIDENCVTAVGKEVDAGTVGAPKGPQVEWPSQRLVDQQARLKKRCDRVCAEVTAAIETCQQQLADVLVAFPNEEAPWRLPAGLTFQDDESDWGRGIQFQSESILALDLVRRKLKSLADYRRKSILYADIEELALFGPRETLALKRIFDMAMAAAKGALEACATLHTLVDGPDELIDNWYSILLLSKEIQFYADSIPDLYDLHKIAL